MKRSSSTCARSARLGPPPCVLKPRVAGVTTRVYGYGLGALAVRKGFIKGFGDLGFRVLPSCSKRGMGDTDRLCWHGRFRGGGCGGGRRFRRLVEHDSLDLPAPPGFKLFTLFKFFKLFNLGP